VANYVYRCDHGVEIEAYRSIHLGPDPDMEIDHHRTNRTPCKARVVIQPSALEFGDFEQGDDDFSLRYRPSGKDQLARPNRTAGQTNVNAVWRKWGKKGMPLEARKDIDSTKITSKPLPATYDIDGHQKSGGHVRAPSLLQGSTQVRHTSELH
jgi:hypothetical protein